VATLDLIAWPVESPSMANVKGRQITIASIVATLTE
jgi:hypothetical protein